jgi:hypothetical protein
LKKLQDALGDLNDIVVHEGLTHHSLAARGKKARPAKRPAEETFAAGHLSGREGARFAPALRQAERAYTGFVKASSFWD